jgi:hydroxymethylglutaryl-CoA lyase
MSDLPKQVTINEEGPREGFQIEKGPIPTHRKVELIDALSGTGLKHIQVASFVPPRNVPGMADAEAVVAGFTPHEGVSYSAIWLNERGFDRAVSTNKLDIKGSISVSASDPFLGRNQRRTASENRTMQAALLENYRRIGVPLASGAVMAAFGCNFEGRIAAERVLSSVSELLALADGAGMRLPRVQLADTMAWATPSSIQRIVGMVRSAYPDLMLTLHLHDTRGMGIANALAGLQMGVDSFDAAVAGLGGCPFAEHRGAAGNVCTEDLVFMCEEMGVATGINLDSLIEVALLAEDIVGHPLPGSVKSGGTLHRRGIG